MPGPIYNWFCVAHSIVDVLSNAAVIRASQVYPRTASPAVQSNLKRRTVQLVNPSEVQDGGLGPFVENAPLNASDETGDVHIGVCNMFVTVLNTYPLLQTYLQYQNRPFNDHSSFHLSLLRVLLRSSKPVQNPALMSPSPNPRNPIPLFLWRKPRQTFP